MTEKSSTISTPITQIRERLEAKAGAASGTRQYWDCVAALLDVADAYTDAVVAWMEATGGAPLSTSIGHLIRQGYLVPAPGSLEAGRTA